MNSVVKLKIEKIKSSIGSTSRQKKILLSLGLNKIGSSKIHLKSSSLEGSLRKVKHLLNIKEV